MSDGRDLPEGSVERDRWLDRLLAELLELPTPERRDLLRERCGSDERLASEAQQLLAVAERAEDSTAEGLPPLSRLAALAPVPPKAIGAYEVLQEIGRGGMGVVYLGVRADGAYEQQVAIKVLDNATRKGTTARFVQERQILAELDHPGVARLLDGGTTEDGRPYFVMEYVEGRSIDAYSDEEDLSLERRLELLVDLCEAVDAAHRSLIVHRDIKPSNVMVDAEGRVRLLDFGIARTIDESATATETGQRALTPQYATPEQYQGRAATVASDVYQLGLVAYELIAQRRPYDVSTTTLEESVRLVCEETPEPPSAAAGGFDVPRDLDLIVMKALSKEPARRYATAEAFGADLSRFLSSEPVVARPDSFAYRAKLFCRRNAAAVSAISLATLLLVVSSGWFLARLANERMDTEGQAKLAEQQRDRAEQVLAFLIDAFATADPLYSPDPDMSVRQLLERAGERLAEDDSVPPGDRARLSVLVSRLEARLGLWESAWSRLQEALNFYEASPLRGSDEHLRAQMDFGRVLVERGDYDALRALLGETAESVGRSQRLLLRVLHKSFEAKAYQEAGDLEEAEAAYRESIELAFSEGSLPAGLNVEGLEQDLAQLLHNRGRLAESIEIMEVALRRAQERYGPKQTVLFGLYSTLGRSLVEAGRVAEGLEHQQRALKIVEERFPEGDARTMGVLARLSNAFREKGDFSEAVELGRRGLAISRQLGGVQEGALLGILGAALRAETPGSKEAEECFLRARELFAEQHGAEHTMVAVVEENLGELLIEQGRFAEAEVLLRRAVAVLELNGRRSELNTAHALVALAQVVAARGETEEARALLEEALELRLKELGPDAKLTEEVQIQLAELAEMDS